MTALSRLRLCPRQHFDKTEMLLGNPPWHVDWFQDGPPRAVQGAPSPPRGGRCRCEATTDEGGRAERDSFVKLRSIRHCVKYPRHRQLRRGYHNLVRQPKNPKALFSQPSVTVFVGKALLRDFMAWTVNFDNQPMFEAHQIKDIVAKGNLPLELGAVASPVANCAPNKCLGLNGPRALLARESAEEGSRDFLRHDGSFAAFFAC